MAKISVIIPVYNAGPYIAECLDALCAQTFADIEVLCIDDGSTDDSWQLINRYAARDTRIKALQQQNSGPATARNRGLENATAPYIMFCDADDWYQPDFCQRMFEIMETEKPDMAVAGCRVVRDGSDCAEREASVSEKYFNPSHSGCFEITDKICRETSVVLWNKIFRKELIERHGIRFPDGCEHDDDTFWIMYAMCAGTIYFENRRLYNYRVRADSIMSNYFRKKPRDKYDRFKVSRFVYEFWRKGGLPKEKCTVVSEFCSTQMTIMFFDLFSTDELEQMAAEANRMALNCYFIVRNGQIFAVDKDVDRGKLLKYTLLSKLTFGRKRKMYKQKKKLIRNQLEIKKLTDMAG